MSIRESFVEHFGEQNASRIEEASIGHINDMATQHGEDTWGSDPFRYHLLNCISHECLDRWAKWHGIDVDVEAVKMWALDHADLHEHDGDMPDYIGLLAGAYYSWLNWPRMGQEPPEGWEDFEAELHHWRDMPRDQQLAEIKAMAERAMELLNEHHDEQKGPSE